MKTQLFVSFLARKAMSKKTGMVPIYCRVRYGDTTAQFSTKIDVPYINWDSKRTRVKGNSKKEMNLKLETLRISIIEKYDALIKTTPLYARVIHSFLVSYGPYKSDNV